MSEKTLPLKGVKVIELSTFIAAPCTARVLADLGADVIKVEAPNMDPLRFTAVNEGRPLTHFENTSFDLENAGKRGIILNTKTQEGHDVLDKMISEADVFITNMRQSPLKRMGFDYETLHAKYPSLVFGYISGYGEVGPDKDLPGFDFTAFYGRGGILGPLRDSDSAPMLTIQGFGDHQVSMNLATGILAALFRAKMTGEGDKVVVSLFHSAVWDISLMLQASQYGAESTQFPMKRSTLANPLVVCHKTKDGRWFQMAMPQYDRHYPIFVKAVGHEELIDDPRFYPQAALQANKQEFYDFLVELIGSKTCEEWCRIFDENDLPYAVAQNWDELLKDEQAWASNIFYEMEYDNGNKRTLVRPPMMFEEIGLPEYKRGPLPGEHTEEILKEYGYSDEQIAAIVEAGGAVKMPADLK